MTVTEIANQLNVTTVTVYRRLKKAGLNIADYRDESNNLTADGVAVIGSLFNGTDTVTDDTAPTTDGATQAIHETEHDAQRFEMAVRLAELTAKLDGMTALIEQLTSERDALRSQLETAQAALAAEIQDRQSERRLLSGGEPAAQPRRRWRWPWSR